MREANSPARSFAVVGIACRFPGRVRSPEDFWRLLSEGRDAIAPIPPERAAFHEAFDEDIDAAGKIYTRLGGFLENVDHFDAAFFGISPREASRIDPQQRLLLEVVWEAFEDARIPIVDLAGSDTGVFVGISTHDYADVQMYPQNRDSINSHSNTGGATSIAANRLSYAYDFRGPSVAVDTACSSSLTAVHFACRALDAGDCSLAVIGGVQVLLRPELSVGFCRATMLSPEGHCKAFDQAADGYVRSEGAGAVILKPLDAALRDGDPIHAVVVGSAVNQDGHSAGLTAPNESSQKAMLRTALARAGVGPLGIQYVEAHGTGTAVGDPIEARAIGEVFAEGRCEEDALWIGSVKANIGHLEAASGIAGFIKTVLMVERCAVPPLLHFKQWNPAIDAGALRLRAPTKLEAWPESAQPARAAVNSFGFGGANACVILQEPPTLEKPAESPDASHAQVLPLSARSPEALRSLASSVAETLHLGNAPIDAICAAAARGRSALTHRLAIVGADAAEIADGLDSFLANEKRANVAVGKSLGKGKLAFVYSGMGPQWWAMGRELLDEAPVFRGFMERCDASLRPYSGWSLIDEFRADEHASRLAHPQLAQVTNFALQASLAELWSSWGVMPDAAIGHSGGAMAAAYAAGIHSLDDSLRLCFHRSRLQGRETNGGRMLAVGLPLVEAGETIRGYEHLVSVGAVNGPNAFTLSGDGAALEAIASALTERRVFARILTVTIAYHSPLMDPIREEFLDIMGDLQGRPETLPFVSDTTGAFQNGAECDAQYWWRAIRGSVRFADSMFTLLDAGYERFVEIGPHPVLAASIAECATARGAQPVIVSSLRRKEPERQAMLRSLAALHVAGHDADWSRLYRRVTDVALPLYPWQGQRHWFEPEGGAATEASGEPDPHPLLARRLSAAHATWQAGLGSARFAWLEDHIIQTGAIFPGAAYVEAMLAAAGRLEDKAPPTLRDIEFQKALLLADRAATSLQIALQPERRRIDVFAALPSDRANWSLHASGRLATSAGAAPVAFDLAALRKQFDLCVDVTQVYERFRTRGLNYGSAFRAIARLWRKGKSAPDGPDVLARIGPNEGLDAGAYGIHPALLDAVFQLLIVAVDARATEDDERVFLPTRLAEIRLFRPAGDAFWAICRLDSRSPTSVVGSFEIFAEDGAPIASIRGLRAQRVEGGADAESIDSSLYVERWEERALSPAVAPTSRDSVFAPLSQSAKSKLAAHITRASGASGWRDYYHDAEPALCAAAAAVTLQAFSELGFDMAPGARLDAAAIAKLKSHDPSGGLWTDRLIALLREARVTTPEDDGERVLSVPDIPALVARFPAYETDFALIVAAGDTLAAALCGERMDALFTPETMALFSRFYESAPASAFYNGVLAQTLRPLIAAHAGAGRLRVLEVGAGTGGATGVVASLLPENAQYVFTDTAGVLLDAARERFADRRNFTVRVLDISRDPLAQGFESGAFDLILAANVVHATPDVAATLGNMKSLLAPGGAVALIEITRDPVWLDVIFGQSRGWWSFSDRDLRPSRPLLPAARWRTTLEGAGFENPWLSEEPDAPGEAAQTVMLAFTPKPETMRPPWIILGRENEPGDRLAEMLASVGHRAIVCRAPMQIAASIAQSADGFSGVVLLSGGDDGLAPSRLLDAPLALVKALAADVRPAPPVYVVTTGATSLDGDAQDDPAQAMVWGFVRSAMREFLEIPFRLVDLGASPDEIALQALAHELLDHDDEGEVALRGGARHVHRLRRIASANLPARKRDDDATPLNWRAEIGARGALATLRLRQELAPEPAPGEVVVEMRAASLNYRDVMLAMGGIAGLEDELSFGRRQLGSDGAGVIVSCGAGVTGVAPGDAVMAVAPGALSRRAATSAALVAPIPAGLDFETAASIPTAFLTAWYALRKMARLEKGERILIHAATGGVGLAAIQIARNIGAEVFATAGSDAKRDYLAALGVPQVMDSRSLAFTDEIAVRTNGAGVDVILNSLTGEAIERGVDCLSPYGRFLEIGKRDIYSGAALSLSPFRQNLSFFAIDLDRLCAERPATVGVMLRELAAEFEAGRLQPIPLHRFAVSEIEDAFRLMAQARHIGKIVLGGFEAAGPIETQRAQRLRGDGTYLVTGGLGGFGLALAEHLASKGVGAIALMGRRAPGASAMERIEAIRASGVRAETYAADVADAAQLDAALAQIARDLPPMRGVFHAAMALDDRRVEELDRESLDAAIAPKAVGAINLDAATAHLSLDHFIMFSSITAVIGNPMQANYGAANAFLDALARRRRAQGRPGLAIDWGVLSEAGYVAARPELKDFLDSQGFRAFGMGRALRILDALLATDAPQVMAADIDWRRLAASAPRAVAAPRLAHLVPAEGDGAAAGPKGALLGRLATLSGAERHAAVLLHLKGALSRVLGLAADTIEADRPLDAMGLDSLLAVELMIILTGDLGLEMPVLELLSGMTLERLATRVAQQLAAHPPSPAAFAPSQAVDAPPPPRADMPPAAAPPLTERRASIASPQVEPLRIVAPSNPAPPQDWSPMQKLIRGASRVGLLALGPLTVDGLEHLPASGAFILAVNHLSMADTPVALAVLPRRTIVIANERLKQNRLLAWALGDLGDAIFIRKGDDSPEALDAALAVLAHGGVIALAPEGTRNRNGLGRGRTGVAYLAARAQTPIIPYVAWGQERWRERLTRLRPVPIHVRIGCPIAPPRSDMSGAQMRAHTDSVMAALAELLPPSYRGAYGAPADAGERV